MYLRCVLILCLLLSGCSVKFVYNNADRLIRWEVSDYVRFNAAQRDYYDAEIATLLYWHRTTQLQSYAAFLEEFAAALPQGMSATDLQGYFARAEAFGDVLEQRLIPIAVQILLSLDTRQFEQLPEKLSKGNLKFAEDEIGKTREESQIRWAREVRDAFQRFSGRMTSEQWTQLQSMAKGYEPHLVLWMEYRERWQTALIELLNAQMAPAQFAEEFAALSRNREAFYGEFGPVFEANEAAGTEVAVWLLNSLTQRQQIRLMESLRDLAQDFRELAAEAPAQPPQGSTCLIPLRDCAGGAS